MHSWAKHLIAIKPSRWAVVYIIDLSTRINLQEKMLNQNVSIQFDKFYLTNL